MVGFAGVCAATWFGMTNLPTGFLPDEDQGYFFVNSVLPEGASLERNTNRPVFEKFGPDFTGDTGFVGI